VQTNTTEIKRRRLTAEVQTLSQLIQDIQDMIKYDPYPQDIPSLTTQLINARADLAQAMSELDQSHVRELQAAKR
jgi:t-SNARE complex subunit (syntaxin)